MIVPVHNHSVYSALDGFSEPEEIARRIAEIGAPGAFITDHGVVSGWRPFKKAMESAGLFAGFGIEAYQTGLGHRAARPEKKGKQDSFHLVLLAKNDEGIRNIMRMSDEASRTGYYYKPRIDWDLLERHSDGVIATSACLGGLVSDAIMEGRDPEDIDRFLKIFKNDFFMEIHTYPGDTQKNVNLELVQIARERGIPLVYANDAHYCKKEEWPLHEIMLCMQMNDYLDNPDRKMSHPNGALSIMSEDQVRAALSYLPSWAIDDAISNSGMIMDRCKTASLAPKKMHLPKYDVGEKTSLDYLMDLIDAGIDIRFDGYITNDYQDRIVTEVETLMTNPILIDYFLIVWDMCRWADQNDIGRGPGRGSVGGSLVAYLLGITDIDPIEYDLFFERFYNIGREDGLPDIDIDFEVSKRHLVKNYLTEKYGENNTIAIGTHIRLKPKATIEKVGRALGIPFADIERIKAIIDGVPDINIVSADQIDWRGGDGVTVAVLETYSPYLGLWEPSNASILLQPFIDRYPDLFFAAEIIGGRISNYGIHASAYVISDVDVRDIIPGMSRKEDGDTSRVMATQVDMHEVEDLGFPKLDILGLRNLDTIEWVRRSTGNWAWADIKWHEQPEEFWEQMDRGYGLGLFQVEGGQAKEIGKKMRPRSIDDLAAIVALNRPGPIRTGVVDRFLARHNGMDSAEYDHEILIPILKSTYGDFLYQEQVIAYFSRIGYDKKQADSIRKMLGKKKASEMDAERPRYMEHAYRFMSEATAARIWDKIIDFSLYSFNKAHAVGYGIMLARTMYIKWKYPREFIIASILTNRTEAGLYVQEARRMRIDVHVPDINRSRPSIAIAGASIYMGLAEVKGVGDAAAKWIIEHGPYTSYENFMSILDAEAEKWSSQETKKGRSPKQIVPAHMIKNLVSVGAFDTVSPYLTPDDRISNERDLLGVVIHDGIQDVINANPDEFEDLNTYEDLANDTFSGRMVLPGMITTVRNLVTKKGKNPGQQMAIVSMQWDGAQAEFVAFPQTYSSYAWMLKPDTIGIFVLKKDMKKESWILESGKKIVRP